MFLIISNNRMNIFVNIRLNCIPEQTFYARCIKAWQLIRFRWCTSGGFRTSCISI